jgi:hypothetical protein
MMFGRKKKQPPIVYPCSVCNRPAVSFLSHVEDLKLAEKRADSTIWLCESHGTAVVKHLMTLSTPAHGTRQQRRKRSRDIAKALQ